MLKLHNDVETSSYIIWIKTRQNYKIQICKQHANWIMFRNIIFFQVKHREWNAKIKEYFKKSQIPFSWLIKIFTPKSKIKSSHTKSKSSKEFTFFFTSFSICFTNKSQNKINLIPNFLIFKLQKAHEHHQIIWTWIITVKVSTSASPLPWTNFSNHTSKWNRVNICHLFNLRNQAKAIKNPKWKY